MRVQKGSRARNTYHHVTVPLGPLQPLHRLLLRRSRVLLGLHRFLQLLPGGSNELGSAAPCVDGAVCWWGHSLWMPDSPLSLGTPSCANLEHLLRRQQPSTGYVF